MIKIPLTDEKRDDINKKYWELIKKHTHIIDSFTDKEGRKELKKYNYKLENFLYNKNKFCEDKLKEIVIADKQKMLYYIKEFEIGTTSTEDIRRTSKNLIEKFFKYSAISQKEGLYDILKDINVSVCPYCNRQYTFSKRLILG